MLEYSKSKSFTSPSPIYQLFATLPSTSPQVEDRRIAAEKQTVVTEDRLGEVQQKYLKSEEENKRLKVTYS